MRKRIPGRALLGLILLLSAASWSCGTRVTEKSEAEVSEPKPQSLDVEIVPGQCIGPVCLGVTYAQLLEEVGELQNTTGYRRIMLGRYPDLGIEVSLSSPDESNLTPDSVVMAVGTLGFAPFVGAFRPGLSVSELEEAIGDTPKDVVGEYIFLPTGVSFLMTTEGVVERVGIYAPYTIRTEPPEMIPASTSMPSGEAQ